MSFGPVLIFDKSAIQSLSTDEAVWLDNFFQSNITPLFFIETLADLEKEIKVVRGRKALSAILHSKRQIAAHTRMPTTDAF